MGTSRGAAVRVVAELVDVEGPLRVSVVALDVPRHAGGRVLGLLLEGHGTSDLGVAAEDSHCVSIRQLWMPGRLSRSLLLLGRLTVMIGQKRPPRCANVLTQGPSSIMMSNVPALTILRVDIGLRCVLDIGTQMEDGS